MNSIFRCLLSHFALCLFSCSVLAQNESETEEIIVNQILDESEVDAGLSDYAEA